VARQTIKKGSKKQSGVVLFARDAGVAVAVVAAVLIGMFAYTGLWPPLVVVESDSMMHGTDNMSHIGAIDTGDLVLVKDVKSASDVKTYMDGYSTGYRTYGDFGDVIIYEKGGSEISTPIIHRAIIYLEANPDGRSYTAPSLKNVPQGKWTSAIPTDTWDNLTGPITIFNVGATPAISLDIGNLLQSGHPESGFITKGDHNAQPDMLYWGPAIGYRPIDVSWVVGKARGEIPWFGLLKLWSTGTINSPAPPNSVRDLWISLFIIVLSPILVDLGLSYAERRKLRAMKKAVSTREEKAEAEDPSSRAVEPPRT